MIILAEMLVFLHPLPASLRHPQPTMLKMANFRLGHQINPH
jgi:hypothetical protein